MRPLERINMIIKKRSDLELLKTVLTWGSKDFLESAENRSAYAKKKDEDTMARFYRGQHNHANSMLKRVERALEKLD